MTLGSTPVIPAKRSASRIQHTLPGTYCTSCKDGLDSRFCRNDACLDRSEKPLPLGRELRANPILRFQIAGQIGRESEMDIFLCRLKFLYRDGAARLQVLHHLLH
jgi:hypothetical protein